MPATPAMAAPERAVCDDDIPAPRRRRRFFTHTALGNARRFAGIVLGASGLYAAVGWLHFGLEPLLATLPFLVATVFPSLGVLGGSSLLLSGRRRTLRVEARTLLLAAEERLCESDARLADVRRLLSECGAALDPPRLERLEARLDYLADLLRDASRISAAKSLPPLPRTR